MKTCALSAVACMAVLFSAEAVAQRNILLLISDDHGLHAGCYGDPVAHTPNLDALAADGTRFTHAFATVASCSASRSVIMTGLHNHSNGQFGHQHSQHDQHTHQWVRGISRILSEAPAAYRTGIVGKRHVQPDTVYPFDYAPIPTREERRGLPGNRDVAWMAAAAKRFFDDGGDQPFFLLMGYSDPHRSAGSDRFANEFDYPGVEAVTFDPATVPVPHHLPDIPETRDQLARYYQSVARMDSGIGMVIDALKTSGHYDHTLIIYISDNGIPFTGAKTNLYDPGIHLPMIVRSPEEPNRGVVNNAMVSWVDIVPTILDWAGVDWDPESRGYALHGRSFLPLLGETNPQGWDEIFASHTFHEIQMYYPMRVIRTREHKLIYNIAHPLTYPLASDLYASPTWQYTLKHHDTLLGEKTMTDYLHRPKWELFDLKADPNELHNLARDTRYAGILWDLQSRLQLFQVRTNDLWLTKYDYE